MAELEIEDFHALMNSEDDLIPTALQDAWNQFPGGSVSAYKAQSKTDKPHWWRAASNNDDDDILYTPDAQAKYVKAHGDGKEGEDALRAALATRGFKIGQTKDRPQLDPSKIVPSNNPYAPGFKGDREKKIAELIGVMGTAAVDRMAKSHNRRIDGSPIPARR